MHVSQFLPKEKLDNYICHIIRDIFPQRNAPIYFGEDVDLYQTFHSPLHSIGACLLYKYPSNTWNPYKQMNLPEHLATTCYQWAIEFNDCFLADGFCDLFISINYDPQLDMGNHKIIAEKLKFLVKKNGLYFLVNPGVWADSLSSYLVLRPDMIKELKKYSILKNEKVYVYENI